MTLQDCGRFDVIKEECNTNNFAGPQCSDSQFTCSQSRQCIEGSKRCDRNNDCPDGSDEFNCPLGLLNYSLDYGRAFDHVIRICF